MEGSSRSLTHHATAETVSKKTLRGSQSVPASTAGFKEQNHENSHHSQHNREHKSKHTKKKSKGHINSHRELQSTTTEANSIKNVQRSDHSTIHPTDIPTAHDVAEAFCSEIADDFLDYALDLCSTRSAYEQTDAIIAWDLRDVWLDIVTMQWQDVDPSILNPTSADIFDVVDEPALPPKFDIWSHGALEFLPRECRESILDPFLREPLLPGWNFRNKQIGQDEEDEDNADNTEIVIAVGGRIDDKVDVPKAKAPRVLSPVEKTVINSSENEPRPRPKSPTPLTSEEEEEEHTWSTTTFVGRSFETPIPPPNTAVGKINSAVALLSVGNMARVSTATKGNVIDIIDSTPIELLYPSMYPLIDIKASSELAYKLTGGKNSGADSSDKGNQLIAFKLPYQTSSESVRYHLERKKKAHK